MLNNYNDCIGHIDDLNDKCYAYETQLKQILEKIDEFKQDCNFVIDNSGDYYTEYVDQLRDELENLNEIEKLIKIY